MKQARISHKITALETQEISDEFLITVSLEKVLLVLVLKKFGNVEHDVIPLLPLPVLQYQNLEAMFLKIFLQ